MADSDLPLGGVRVLDLSEGFAGPLCAKLLGALGADVLKVERPGGGDIARTLPPFLGDDPGTERSGLFLYLNTNKRGVTLDVEQEGGRGLARQLIERSDLVIESFAPGQLDVWGLGYEALAASDPALTLVSVTEFGQTGPYRDFTSSDLVAAALGGLLYMSGSADREPLQLGGTPAAAFAGLSAFSGALVALHYREATGEGQWVDVSELEGLAVAQEYPGVTYAYKHEIRERSNDFAPTLEASDGYVGLMYRQPNWHDFCEMIEMPELEDDPRFATTAARRQHADQLNALVGPWIRQQRKHDLYERGQSMRMPVGYLCTAADLIESPQYRERGFFTEIDHPTAGRLTYPGLPFLMHEASGHQLEWPTEPAPLLGQHNEQVYCEELGLGQSELASLLERGVV